MTTGISFPAAPDGSRSTTPTGRGIVGDALRAAAVLGYGASRR